MSAGSRSLFSADLAQLKVTLRQLGECAIEMLEGAMEALVSQDYDLAEQVRKRDNLADALDDKVDEDCVTMLALQAPVAKDLRIIMGSARIATDLERVADYAKDIAKVARRLSGEDYFWPLEDIPSMAQSCAAMGRMSLAALDDVDDDMARKCAGMDQEVDARWKLVREQLIQHMEADPSRVRQAAQLLLVARYLERIGDHIVNVAERVHYMATGELRSLDDE